MVYNSGTDNQRTSRLSLVEKVAPKRPSRPRSCCGTRRRVVCMARRREGMRLSPCRRRQEHDTSLNHRLIEQNTILEAFGNAKTLRGYNSSRFGKFMKLQFTSDGAFKLAGALVETCLLENHVLYTRWTASATFTFPTSFWLECHQLRARSFSSRMPRTFAI